MSATSCCWAPSCARGATPSDIEAAFPAWQITDVEVADTDPDPIALKLKFDEHWYRLRRK